MKRMARILICMTFVALLLGTAVEGGNRATAVEGVAVTINAPDRAVQGESFTVTVDVTKVTGFDAGQFDVSFDASLVQLDDVTAGAVGTTPIPIALWNQLSAGICRIIVNVPGVPGVDGSGYLAVLHCHAASPAVGSSAVSLSNGFLNDNLGSEITAAWIGNSVNVCEPGTAPRPGDANRDGIVSVADIASVERIIVGLEAVMQSADANQDGAINAADITALEAISVGATQLWIP